MHGQQHFFLFGKKTTSSFRAPAPFFWRQVSLHRLSSAARMPFGTNAADTGNWSGLANKVGPLKP